MPTNETIYQLRCVDDPRIAVDVQGSSKTNYAQVVGIGSTNNTSQRWKYYATGSVLANVNSTKVLATATGTLAAGAAVGQYTYTDADWDKWTVTTVKVATDNDAPVIDGVACESVTLMRKSTSLYLSAKNALEGTSDVLTVEASGGIGQEWALYPSFSYWKDAPIPYDSSIAKSMGGTRGQTIAIDNNGTASVYVAFKVSKMYGVSMRYCTRLLDLTGTWGAWSDWSAWTTQTTTTANDYYWTGAIPTNYTLSTGKCMEVRVQLCSMVTYNSVTYYGDAMDQTYRVAISPEVTLMAASMSPVGLNVTYTSDYSPTRLCITYLGDKECKYEVEGLGLSGSFVIPLDVSGWYENGDDVFFSYKVGNDVVSLFAATSSVTLAVSNTGGTLAPDITVDDGGIMHIDCENAQGYIVLDGEVYEGTTLPVPIDREFDLWVCTTSGTFNCYHRTLTSGESAYTAGYSMPVVKPSHALVCGDTAIVVKHADGISTENMSVSAESESTPLDGAEWMHVAMSGTKTGDITIDGILHWTKDETTAADVRGIVGKHCIYRSPFGWYGRVAVKSANTTKTKKTTQVSINAEVEQ